MKEIVICSDYASESLLGMLKALFPECELHVVPKTPAAEKAASCRPDAVPGRDAGET